MNTKQLVKKPKVYKIMSMRNGVKIWLEEEEEKGLKKALIDSGSEHKFIEVGGRIINTADLQGIFCEEDFYEI